MNITKFDATLSVTSYCPICKQSISVTFICPHSLLPNPIKFLCVDCGPYSIPLPLKFKLFKLLGYIFQ
jgi:hypothetical protein